MNKLIITDLGIIPYKQALELQQTLREQRIRNEIPNTILLLEHEPVYTIGKDNIDKEKLIKNKLPAPLYEVERGGKITYHGPGQVIGYFIFKIPRSKIGAFVDAIEDLTINIVQEYDIKAYSRKSETDTYGKNIRGAWCMKDGLHKKIAAQGIETKLVPNQEPESDPPIVTMHGFALNINTNLNYFFAIHPCGFSYDVMTSLQKILYKKIPMPDIKEKIKFKLENQFFK